MSAARTVSWASELVCSRTGATAPLDRPAFLSPAGAPWLVRYRLSPSRGKSLAAALPGREWSLWRYRELLPVSDPEDRIDLGEGATPLIRLRREEAGGIRLWLKEEAGNPTGSFKARGLSLAVNRARELGAPGVELASAGNAGVAMAAYAAAAGLPCRVALPGDAPAAIRRACEELGADVLLGGENLVQARQRLAERDRGFWDLSTLREPYRVEGKKTMGFELAEQFDWSLPDWIVYPTGGGTGIVGMEKAFAELRELGLLSGARPRLAMVQMEGCQPLVRAFDEGLESAPRWERPATSVWGLRVPQALGDFLVLRAIRESRGAAVAVPEAAARATQRRVAREAGVRLGPEGAAALAAVGRLVERGEIVEGQRVVVFQTGDPANYGWESGDGA